MRQWTAGGGSVEEIVVFTKQINEEKIGREFKEFIKSCQDRLIGVAKWLKSRENELPQTQNKPVELKNV